jgi:hypothetical protein
MVTHRSPVRRSTSLASAVSWRCPASFVPPSSIKRTIGCLAISPTTIALRERGFGVRRCSANAARGHDTSPATLVVCVLLGRVGARTNFCGELFGGAPEKSGHVGELFDELGLVLAGA